MKRDFSDWARCLCSLMLVITACDDTAEDAQTQTDDDATTDSADDTSPDTEPAFVCPPERLRDGICAPAPPRFADWPCPEGWTPTPALIDAQGVSFATEDVPQFNRCQPPAVVEPPTDCAPGTFPVVGFDTCQPHGAPCPEGDWPSDADLRALAPDFSGKIWFVKADGPTSGAFGTRESPFGRLETALIASNGGDIIALSRGTFSEPVHLQRPVALVGACVAETTFQIGPLGNPQQAMVTLERGARLANVTLSGAQPGVQVTGAATDAEVSVHAVRVHQATGLGLLAEARGALTDVWISQTQPLAADGRFGYGVQGTPNATLSARNVAVTGSRAIGVALDGGRMTAAQLLIAQTETGASGFAAGFAMRGGSAEVSDLASLHNLSHGVHLQGGAELKLSGGSIGPMRPLPQGDPTTLGNGVGVFVRSGSALSLERVAIRDSACNGLAVDNAIITGQWLDIQRNRACTIAGQYAAALHIFGEVKVELAQVAVSGSLRTENFFARGVLLRVASGEVRMEDLVVSDTDDEGIVVWTLPDAPLRASFTRALVHESRGTGLTLLDAGDQPLAPSHQLSFQDLWVTQIPSLPNEAISWGVIIGDGVGEVSLERLRASDVGGGGVWVAGDATLSDVHISQMRTETDDTFGVGLGIAQGAQVSAERAHVERSRYIGVGVWGASLVMRDARVRGTLPLACAETTCPGQAAGTNVYLNKGDGVSASLDLARFESADSLFVGLQLGADTHVKAADGLIARNRIGLNVNSALVDLASDFVNVRLVENDIDQNFSELPLPTLQDVIKAIEGDPTAPTPP